MLCRITSSLIAILAVSIWVAAQRPAGPAPNTAKPNYSGVWRLNVAMSDFGSEEAPRMEIEIIEHREPSFKCSIDQTGGYPGQIKDFYIVRTDGKETVSGTQATFTQRKGHWENDGLVIETSFTANRRCGRATSKYKLSDDGKTLTVLTHFSGGTGAFDLKRVYDRQ